MTAPSQSPAAAATEFLLGWADTFESCGYDDMAGNIRKAAALLSEHDRLTEEVARLTKVLMRIETAGRLDDVLRIARAALPKEPA